MLCVLTLVLVSFAHRPAETDARLLDPQIAEYVALGGALTDLCLSGGGEEDGAGHAGCPACILAKSLVLAANLPDRSGTIGPIVERAIWPEIPLLSGHGLRAPPARGPPLIQMI